MEEEEKRLVTLSPASASEDLEADLTSFRMPSYQPSTPSWILP